MVRGGLRRMVCRRRQESAGLARRPARESLSRSAPRPSLWCAGRGPVRCRSSARDRAHRRPWEALRPGVRRLAHIGARRRRCRSTLVPAVRWSARDAATDTGLPPKVEACAPGGQFITSALAIMALRAFRWQCLWLRRDVRGWRRNVRRPTCGRVRPMPDCTSSKMSRMPWRWAIVASSSKNLRGGTM